MLIKDMAFDMQIATPSGGRIDMQYRRVDCTPPLPVSVAIDNNAGVGGWLRLVVEVSLSIHKLMHYLLQL